MQSSLAIVLSLTLGFSPHPCVSIFGTGYCMIITRSFSWKLASRTSVLAAAFHTPHAFAFRQPDLPGCQLPRLHLLFQLQDALACSVTPSPALRYGILHPLSIDYASRPRLRSRLTQSGRTFLWKPWVFGAWDSHPRFATHTGILSSMRSTAPYGTASPHIERSPTTHAYA